MTYVAERIFAVLLALLPKVHADGAVATQHSTENGGTPMPLAVRAVYGREIEFRAMPLMVFRQFAALKTVRKWSGLPASPMHRIMTQRNLLTTGRCL